MAADMKWIQGEVSEDPTKQDADVERLLRGFVRALLAEQTPSAHSQAQPQAQAEKQQDASK
jgi:hypothetical protein